MSDFKKDLLSLDIREIEQVLDSVNKQICVLVDQQKAVKDSLERMYRAKEVFEALHDIKRSKP